MNFSRIYAYFRRSRIMGKFNFNNESGVLVQLVFADTESDLVTVAKNNSSFAGKKGETFYLPSVDGDATLIYGLGDKAEVTLEDLRNAGFKIVNTIKGAKATEANIQLVELDHSEADVIKALTEGAINTEYKFSHKTGEDEKVEVTVNFNNTSADLAELEAAVKETEVVMEGVFIARDLTNATSNYMHPEDLAQAAVDKLEPLGVKVTVYDEVQMQEMGMEAAYSVGKGSNWQPRFVVMEYNNDDSTEDRLGLVGKAICYDTGGYSLKPSNSMITMHEDMAGAASVIGGLYALAKNNVKTNLIATFAASENTVSGSSYRVGDIIGSLSGKTIEIQNTDAEGRVTLADSVYYTSKQDNVVGLIDIATLTGAAISALGSEYTGVITNNEEFYADVKASADAVGEKVWLLPNDQVFKDANKSKVADLTNSAKGGAGTATAGLFIGEFLDNQELPWVHLDVAGTSWYNAAKGYLPERATGYHVKLFYHLLAK